MDGQPSEIFVRQQYTMITNKYWIHSGSADGPVIAFAEQKKMKLREEVNFYSDEHKSQVLFSFKARQVIDMAATTDVYDAQGAPIGEFAKDAARSLLNSTWYLRTPAINATGRERSQGIALVRRFGGWIPVVGNLLEAFPWQFHFDFVDDSGNTVLVDERVMGLRDQYRVQIPQLAGGKAVDWRMAAAIGVALDAFQGR